MIGCNACISSHTHRRSVRLGYPSNIQRICHEEVCVLREGLRSHINGFPDLSIWAVFGHMQNFDGDVAVV